MGHTIHGAHRIGLLEMAIFGGYNTTHVFEFGGNPLHEAAKANFILVRGGHRFYYGSGFLKFAKDYGKLQFQQGISSSLMYWDMSGHSSL